MRVVITNAGERSEEIAKFLAEKVSKWIEISDIQLEGYCEECAKKRRLIGHEGHKKTQRDKVSFELESSIDQFPEDYQMMILTNAFSGSNLQFLIPTTGFRWVIA